MVFQFYEVIKREWPSTALKFKHLVVVFETSYTVRFLAYRAIVNAYNIL